MNNSPITLILILANVAFSIYGFSNMEIFNRFMFQVRAILQGREWHRIITSGFLHVNPLHLIVNMLSLYFCGPVLEDVFARYAIFSNGGPLPYIVLYFGSLFGGDLLALLMHRNTPNYSAVGASGAISGLLFALAVLNPNGWVSIFFFLPCPIWLFAILYIAYSLFGIRSGHGNIGHSAHLGGALTGLVITAAFFPAVALQHWIFLLILVVPSLVVLYAIYQNPGSVNNPAELFSKMFQRKPREPKRAKPKGLEINLHATRQQELDALLDKVSRHGMQSLSTQERRRLDELSNQPGNRSSDR